MNQPLQPVPPPHAAGDHSSHKCEETLRRVLLLLDHQLSDSEQSVLMVDLNTCDDCLKKYNIEKDFKSYMQGKFVKKSCTDQLRQRIQEIVRNQIN
jgi:anti-sigma factor (TIGR02949 family)